MIRREFDIGEGDAYNRALIDRAERRLKNLNYFKTVKITNEPGSAPDRVVVNVDVEEMPTGEFSISGGYSTADGFIAEVSVADRNLMGRGQFAKASVSYGQYTRGFDLSFVEPYLLGYRMAGGIDLFARQTLATSYVSYNTQSIGDQFAPRLCAVGRTLVAAALFDLPAGDHAAGCSIITVMSTTTPTVRLRLRPDSGLRCASVTYSTG